MEMTVLVTRRRQQTPYKDQFFNSRTPSVSYGHTPPPELLKMTAPKGISRRKTAGFAFLEREDKQVDAGKQTLPSSKFVHLETR